MNTSTRSPAESRRDEPADRLAGLTPTTVEMLRQAWLHLNAGQLYAADQALTGAELIAPRHMEVQRTRGVLLTRAGRFADARRLIETLLARQPEDPLLLGDLAEAALGCDDGDTGLAALRRVCELQPEDASSWFNLGRHLMDRAWTEESLPALERAVVLAPEHAHARTLYADVMVLLGRFEQARAQYLEVLRRAPTIGAAWWGLANIKTVRLSDGEIRHLEAMMREPSARESDRLAMGCVLAKAYEDHGRHAEAFAILTETNTRISRRRPWDAARFRQLVDATLAEFEKPHAEADDPRLGEEIIFIVSLPRSGSTLTEQILAAHSEVEGASELGDVSAVMQVESERRGIDFPFWVDQATPEDWTRLGRNYLARTARWRTKRPRSTDKMPNNWLFVGAIRAMLPGARIVNCRRDPVETCWSCYKQMFSISNEFSYDLDYLARFWQDYDHAMRQWHRQKPGHVHDQVYEQLLAEPEAEVRALLDYCGLAFEQSCLRFHEVERSVRTASAAQVREPLRRNTARSAGYGALLDPLRAALASARLP
jgi:tetratricopeptide (TPR) repeat protein